MRERFDKYLVPRAHEVPGLRYETCVYCGMRWNVAHEQQVSEKGYLCPNCRHKGVRV